MLIGTAIIEAGSSKFSNFDWGEDLVKAVNSFLDQNHQITIETTGHELEEILGKMGKYARRAIEKYPLSDDSDNDILSMLSKFLKVTGIKNGLIILLAVGVAIVGLLFGGMEMSLYSGDGIDPDNSLFFKVFELVVKSLDNGN